MLRKILAAALLLIVGYVGGVFFGYRAAVIDYVENDADKIESMAEDIYPSSTQPIESLDQSEVNSLAQQAEEEDNDESRAFH